MNENKECQIKFRLTARQKEQIGAYCAANGLNISEFLRLAASELLKKSEVD